ncbi:isochorismatase domain-containing protein 1 [Octodon degus]|uniref:Isochorismatase domain-containing protein 1 n=1 Tax=Octodon degus TaxID=10160 RepID=A0A6P3ET14_OCTDE|nr:isochorismatase domain-containing protein 1 [Octodon degus]
MADTKGVEHKGSLDKGYKVIVKIRMGDNANWIVLVRYHRILTVEKAGEDSERGNVFLGKINMFTVVKEMLVSAFLGIPDPGGQLGVLRLAGPAAYRLRSSGYLSVGPRGADWGAAAGLEEARRAPAANRSPAQLFPPAPPELPEGGLTTLGNLTPSSTVFFCCDMQERFRPAIKYFGDIISVGQRLLQGARILGIPVIVTEQYPKGLGSTVQEIDLTGVKLVLPKSKFSMVLPEVEAALAEIPGVRSVVLFGVETHVCIQQTALELVGRGIEVHIVADATSSRSMMDRMFALERLARTGIIVTTSEAVLLQLVADKDHPKFKEIQNLIKASAPESGLLSKV